LFTAGTASANQTICYGETPASLSSTAPMGVVELQTSAIIGRFINNGSGKSPGHWDNIKPVATNLIYAPGPLTSQNITG